MTINQDLAAFVKAGLGRDLPRNQMVADLRGIARAVDLYWTRSGRLPTGLEETSNELEVFDFRTVPARHFIQDPQTISNKAKFPAKYPIPTAEDHEPFPFMNVKICYETSSQTLTWRFCGRG